MFSKQTITLSILFSSLLLLSQNKEMLIGYYAAPGGQSIFKFYKEENKYFAKPVWMKRPERLDELNPNVLKRKHKILGSVILWDFEFDGEDTWTNGHIYDANKGKIYKGRITRDKEGNMSIRGFVGVRVVGKTEYFVKVDFKE